MVVVAVTGAAGQIAYSLYPHIAGGRMFGAGVPVEIRMMDIEVAVEAMGGVKMELEDGAFPLLKGVTIHTSPEEAFTGANAVIMLGAFPRKPGMERKDLLAKNR